MTTLEQLPPDQRAVLSLLLRQSKHYEEVATVLGISPEAVHDRAHAALAVLAPRQARLLDPGARDLIGDYLLGQQDDGQAAATKTYLAGSTPAREWARALAVELVKLAAEAVPEIPAAPEQAAAPERTAAPEQAAAPERTAAAGAVVAAAPGAGVAAAAARAPRDRTAAPGNATPARDLPATAPGSASPISRRGGAILLGAIVVIAAVVVAIALSSGGSANDNKSGARNGEQVSSTKSGAAETGGKGSTKAKAKLEKAAALKAVQPGGSAEGAALIASEGSKRALYLTAKGLAATEGFSYVVWLLPKSGQPIPFGRTPSVSSKGTLQAAEVLTQEPSTLSGVEITRETATHPSSPGTVVLKGDFVGS
jgi:Anti-sigma-K factor rskA, C-terminal/Sigma-70, region 4